MRPKAAMKTERGERPSVSKFRCLRIGNFVVSQARLECTIVFIVAVHRRRQFVKEVLDVSNRRPVYGRIRLFETKKHACEQRLP